MELSMQEKSELLDKFYQSLITSLESIDRDFEVLLSSKALKVVANLSNKLFQKQAAIIINAFSDVLDIYQEEYETILLQSIKPSSLENRELLKTKQQSFKVNLNNIVQRLNVKAQILLEDLKISKLTLDEKTQIKLEEIKNITIEQLLARFKADSTQ